MAVENLYNKKVTDYFLNPRNMGEIKNPSGVGRVGNPLCGDVMELYLKVKRKKEKGKSKDIDKENAIITDAKFKTFGCGAAIASSSMMTEMIKGKSVKEALKISNQAAADALGGLPPIKRHCSVLAHGALANALKDWQEKSLKK